METNLLSTSQAFSPSIQRYSKAMKYLPAALSVVLIVVSANIQSHEREGRQVVEEVCFKCHGNGTDGAPRIGDQEAWSQRAALGLSGLTRHALQGIRKMPAHGGNAALSNLEIALAITEMVNRSGGNWIPPVSDTDLSHERSGQQVVKARCANCHEHGLNGAPAIGDQHAWVERLNRGIEHATRSAIRGHGGMPPRGGQANLTDEEIQAAILYMFNPASANTRQVNTQAETPMIDTPNRKFVGGISISLGVIPVSQLRALPRTAPERAMHGGLPNQPGYYHVNVTLNNVTTKAPVKGAHVQMAYERPGLGRDVLELRSMAFSPGSYGNYFKPRAGETYHISLNILTKGAFRTIDAKFESRQFN